MVIPGLPPRAGLGAFVSGSSRRQWPLGQVAARVMDTTVSAAQSTFTADDTTILADGTAVSTFTVTAKNAAGQALSGKTVSLSRATV